MGIHGPLLCDFGVTHALKPGQDTKVYSTNGSSPIGSPYWMAYELIVRDASGSLSLPHHDFYTKKSDVWSLGITLIELALGQFPFPFDEHSSGILDLLQWVVNEPAPILPESRFPEDLVSFVAACLIKDPEKRPTPVQLVTHSYVSRCDTKAVNLCAWAAQICK